MNRMDILSLALNSGAHEKYEVVYMNFDDLERFFQAAYNAGVEAECETIMDEWWMCVQSDLENGVKSLNENAAEKWRKEYPEISEFGAFLNSRGETK